MATQKKIYFTQILSTITSNKTIMAMVIAGGGAIYANAETFIRNAVEPLIEERVTDMHQQIRRDIARSFARIEIALQKDTKKGKILRSDRENRKQEQDIENEYLNLMEKEDERYGN